MEYVKLWLFSSFSMRLSRTATLILSDYEKNLLRVLFKESRVNLVLCWNKQKHYLANRKRHILPVFSSKILLLFVCRFLQSWLKRDSCQQSHEPNIMNMKTCCVQTKIGPFWFTLRTHAYFLRDLYLLTFPPKNTISLDMQYYWNLIFVHEYFQNIL